MENMLRDRSPATIRRWLTESIARQLQWPADDIDPSLPLTELGMDSVSVLTVCLHIEERLGVPVDPVMVWDHPTIDALSQALSEALLEPPGAAVE
jgi:acyl carrier protein